MFRKNLSTEPRIIDADKGIVEYVASNETIDSHGDKVLISGWRFDRFRKNAPFLDSHRKWSVKDQLGRVLGARLEDEALVEKVQWAIGLGNHEIDTAFRMTEAGFLKAVSVGFRPVKAIFRWLDDLQKKPNRKFVQQVAVHGVSKEEAEEMNALFIEQQQIELSAVTIGSNPDALLKSYEEGVVSDEDLHKLGFEEDQAFEFLTKAAGAYESPECDEVMKLLIEREMRRTLDGGSDHEESVEIVRDEGADSERRQEFLKRLEDVTSEAPGKPSGGVEATRMADGRREFLKALGK